MISVSFYAHCLCHWAPLKTAWLHSLCTLPAGISIHYDSLSLLFSGLNSPCFLSLSLQDQSLNHLCSPLLDSPVHQYPSQTRKPRIGLGVASPVLNRGAEFPPSACWQHSQYSPGHISLLCHKDTVLAHGLTLCTPGPPGPSLTRCFVVLQCTITTAHNA